MHLSERERANIIAYFKENTYYSEEYLYAIKNHAQLFSMYKRTQERMDSYPEEIIAYYNDHPEIYVRPSDEEIRNMKYEELSHLRKELGLSRKNKKVRTSIEAKSTADKARSVLTSQSTAKVAAQVIITNMTHKQTHDYEDEQFLTPEEISMMYPVEELSADELAERGIVITPDFATEEAVEPRKNK